MKITTVTVARKFNLGNYEMLSLSAEASLSETDNPLDVWNVLRDNIEMCFTDMQRKKTTPQVPAPSPVKPTPQQTAQPKPQVKDPLVCPICGGKKKADYNQCYNCWEKEKAE